MRHKDAVQDARRRNSTTRDHTSVAALNHSPVLNALATAVRSMAPGMGISGIGRKLCILQNCNQASFCVVGRTRVVSNQFSTEYESIVINGTMICQLEETEKRKALELLLDKYSSEDKKVGLKYIEKSFHRTHVLKLVIKVISGKCKKINQPCQDY